MSDHATNMEIEQHLLGRTFPDVHRALGLFAEFRHRRQILPLL